MWVFPGGKLEEADRCGGRGSCTGRSSAEVLPSVRCAIRETYEEAGVLVGADRLVSSPRDGSRHRVRSVLGSVCAKGIVLDTEEVAYLSNWVTPAVSPLRFDTRFFVALVGAGNPGARHHPAECSMRCG